MSRGKKSYGFAAAILKSAKIKLDTIFLIRLAEQILFANTQFLTLPFYF